MSTQQKAVAILEPKGKIAVTQVDIPEPGLGEVLVEVRAAALNPIDWNRYAREMFIIAYPCVLGIDSAGVVKKLGEGVTNVAVGDRVLHQGGMNNRQATFQQYTTAPADTIAKIPANLSFDEAATVPLTMATAALGLYGKKNKPRGGLELFPPWVEGGEGKYAGQPILIIGGSSSVGQFAIQFARLSGFSPIITTSSKRNEAYVKSLGATHVIDREAPLADLENTVKEITLKPIEVAFDAVSSADTQSTVYDLLAPGGKAMLFFPLRFDESKLTGDKEIAHVYGDVKVPEQREIGLSLYAKVTELLASGTLKPNNFEVLPNGLESVLEGLHRLRDGKVSAGKLVVHPQETP